MSRLVPDWRIMLGLGLTIAWLVLGLLVLLVSAQVLVYAATNIAQL